MDNLLDPIIEGLSQVNIPYTYDKKNIVEATNTWTLAGPNDPEFYLDVRKEYKHCNILLRLMVVDDEIVIARLFENVINMTTSFMFNIDKNNEITINDADVEAVTKLNNKNESITTYTKSPMRAQLINTLPEKMKEFNTKSFEIANPKCYEECINTIKELYEEEDNQKEETEETKS